MRVPRKLQAFFSETDLDAIERVVAEAESRTSGEIRVHVVHRVGLFARPRRRALREFYRLGVDRTRDGTGVLIFVVPKNHRFEIVADQGLNDKIRPEAWRAIAGEMTEHIHERTLANGICHGVERIGALLAEHAPRRPDDANELPDRVSFEEGD